MFSNLKAWALAAVGGVLAVGLLLLRAFQLGKRVKEADQLELDFKETENANHRLQNAVRAGDAVTRAGTDRLRDDDGHKRK